MRQGMRAVVVIIMCAAPIRMPIQLAAPVGIPIAVAAITPASHVPATRQEIRAVVVIIMCAAPIPTPIQLAMRLVECISGVQVATTPMDDAPPPGTGISARAIDTHAERIPTPIRGCGRVGIRIAVVEIMRR